MEQSMYHEIGGREAVETVVDDFYNRVLSDDQLVGFFEDYDMAQLRAHQVQFISSVAGGPVEYTGDEMRTAHEHLDIEERDFDAVGNYLAEALEDNGVAEENVGRIMSQVAALKEPILNK